MAAIGQILSLFLPLIVTILKMFFGLDKPQTTEVINEQPIKPNEDEVFDSLGVNIKS